MSLKTAIVHTATSPTWPRPGVPDGGRAARGEAASEADTGPDLGDVTGGEGSMPDL